MQTNGIHRYKNNIIEWVNTWDAILEEKDINGRKKHSNAVACYSPSFSHFGVHANIFSAEYLKNVN